MTTCDFCSGTYWLSDEPDLGPCACYTPQPILREGSKAHAIKVMEAGFIVSEDDSRWRKRTIESLWDHGVPEGHCFKCIRYEGVRSIRWFYMNYGHDVLAINDLMREGLLPVYILARPGKYGV